MVGSSLPYHYYRRPFLKITKSAVYRKVAPDATLMYFLITVEHHCFVRHGQSYAFMTRTVLKVRTDTQCA